MARLVVIAHEYDTFATPRRFFSPPGSSYLLFDVLRQLESFGHSWRLCRGTDPVDGDVALLHVDATFVDQSYLALGDRYARTINFGTGDISKRRISSQRLMAGEDWAGPVIVKANRNAMGSKEATHNRRAAKRGRPPPHPGLKVTGPYRILESIGQVDAATWADPDLIVERFKPERDGDNYVIRTWVFMGSKERCTRQVTTDPIAKAARVIHYEPAEIPDALRAERERLGFDFGKFDFVIHDGAPILLDTNRTPGVARAIEPLMKSGARNLAEGLDELVRD